MKKHADYFKYLQGNNRDSYVKQWELFPSSYLRDQGSDLRIKQWILPHKRDIPSYKRVRIGYGVRGIVERSAGDGIYWVRRTGGPTDADYVSNLKREEVDAVISRLITKAKRENSRIYVMWLIVKSIVETFFYRCKDALEYSLSDARTTVEIYGRFL